MELEDEPDVSATQQGAIGFLQRVNIGAIDLHLAGVRVVDAAQQVDTGPCPKQPGQTHRHQRQQRERRQGNA